MRRALTIVASTAVLGCGRSWTIDLSDGSGSASASGEGPVDGCTPTGDVELCDGLDNDCDGLIDEDIEPVTCGFGGCQTIVYCEDGMMPPCVPREPGPELCNLQDDDCDGEVDEGFSFGPPGAALVLRNDEFDTGSCTSCSWASGPTLATLDEGLLGLWRLGLYGGSEQPTLYGRFVDSSGLPTGPVQLLRDDFILGMYPLEAIAPMPPRGLPIAIEHRTPGQPDVSGLLFVDGDGATSLVQPIVGTGASNVERTVWTGQRFITTWEEDAKLQIAVLDADGELERMAEVDPLERAARATLGVYPGRVGVLVSRVRVEMELWDMWFILLDSQGNVITPAHPIDVEYGTWQRLIGTDEGWLHVFPGSFDEPSTRQVLSVDGEPIGEALPFADGRSLDDSGSTDTFVARPGLGEMITVWGDGEAGQMHVEFLDGTGEVLRGWSGEIGAAPGQDTAYVIDPHVQFVDDRVVVIWREGAEDAQPNRVLMREFACTP